jgi:hypothetical protein
MGGVRNDREDRVRCDGEVGYMREDGGSVVNERRRGRGVKND